MAGATVSRPMVSLLMASGHRRCRAEQDHQPLDRTANTLQVLLHFWPDERLAATDDCGLLTSGAITSSSTTRSNGTCRPCWMAAGTWPRWSSTWRRFCKPRAGSCARETCPFRTRGRSANSWAKSCRRPCRDSPGCICSWAERVRSPTSAPLGGGVGDLRPRKFGSAKLSDEHLAEPLRGTIGDDWLPGWQSAVHFRSIITTARRPSSRKLSVAVIPPKRSSCWLSELLPAVAGCRGARAEPWTLHVIAIALPSGFRR